MSRFSLWRASQPLVLASRSAGRRHLLEAAGIPVDAIPAAIDERAAEEEARAAGADAAGVALALARAKAADVATAKPGRLVLGADQTLAVDGEPLHKPSGREEAAGHLRRLSGREHLLHSALVLQADGLELLATVETARLRMRPLSDRMISAYLDAAGGAVLASVGAYQLEGLGIHLFDTVAGDQSTIVGLPMLPLLAALRSEGFVVA